MPIKALFSKLHEALATTTAVAASLCLLSMMCVVVADVVMRTLNPNWRIYGTLDMVEFSLNWTICLSIAAALFAGQVIVVDLVDRLDPRGILKRFGNLALLGILTVMGWQTVRPALNVLEWGEETFDMGLPKFWYWIAIWVGLGLSVLATAFLVFIKDARK